MSKLKVYFKFDIGEIVCTVTALANMRHGLGSPKALIVQEQVAKRCAGGTQLFYYVSNDGTPIQVPEANLVLAKDVADEITEATTKQLGESSDDKYMERLLALYETQCRTAVVE